VIYFGLATKQKIQCFMYEFPGFHGVGHLVVWSGFPLELSLIPTSCNEALKKLMKSLLHRRAGAGSASE